VLGHESSGIVDECGSEVTTLKVGDRVALEPGAACHTCHFCRKGNYNLCKSMRFAATPPYDGTLSTFYCLPEDFCYVLPEHVSLETGALVEPLSIAVHCVKLANISPTSSVVVFGAGPIGLLCCAVARAYGASRILAIDINESRLAFAKEYAATDVYRMQQGSPSENAGAILSSYGIDEGVDVIIEATGVESCISCGVSLMKRGGTFVQAGLGQSTITFPVGEICSKEGVFKGSFRYGPGDYETAIELLRSGKVEVEGLVTHKYGFAAAEDAFKAVSQQVGIKSIIYGPGFEGS
jgi:L-iditol 2-dehydrogenase